MGDPNEISPVEIRRLEARWKSDVDSKLDDINVRVRVIERLVWVAVGGTAVIAAIAVTGISIIIKQGERIDAIALRQASAIAERIAHEESMKAEIARIREKIK